MPSATNILPDGLPIIIAHRGASGERPEHTLAAYQLAIDQGADYIEPDLVLTKDGVLVARHENEIGGTTDVADRPEFADRKTSKTIDGEVYAGWFTEDFTLAELKTLRAKERLSELRPDNKKYDGQFQVPTFEEVLELLAEHERTTGKRVGVYPETKHPAYFSVLGLQHDSPMLKLLTKYGFYGADDPVFIQSFEISNLKRLKENTNIRLIQLIGDKGGPPDRSDLRFADMLTPSGLSDIARYAAGIGIAKSLIGARGPEDFLQQKSPLVLKAHQRGLRVHVWTIRRENYFMADGFKNGTDPAAIGRINDEIETYLAAGVDGLFTDNPREASVAATAWEAE